MPTRVESVLREQLEAGLRDGIYPGAGACVGLFGENEWTFLEVGCGQLADGLGPVAHDTIYDLASLTKPCVATTALRLYQTGLFGLDVSVAAVLPEADGLPVGERTWEEVLTHRAGLEAWVPFYESMPSGLAADDARQWVLNALLPRYDERKVGTSTYSDLGYILTGLAIERAAGGPLDALVHQHVLAPLGLDDGMFYGATRTDREWTARCAPTGWSEWRARELVAEVHDDNCASLGGVAGHAGMFGSARAVARFGAAQVSALAGRLGALDEDLVQHAVAERPGGSHRLGWDGKADQGSAAGERIDRSAFGHLGFTGTSLWCDPKRGVVITLLTNRVAVSTDNQAIRAFRPRFHDAVIDAIDGA